MTRRAALLALLSMYSGIAAAQCGSRGGPGVRLANGRCASWADVQRGRTGSNEGAGTQRPPVPPSAPGPSPQPSTPPAAMGSAIPSGPMHCVPDPRGGFHCVPD